MQKLLSIFSFAGTAVECVLNVASPDSTFVTVLGWLTVLSIVEVMAWAIVHPIPTVDFDTAE